MLWKKENGIYENICINSKYDAGEVEKIYKQMNLKNYTINKIKNNATSTFYRELGNDIFEKKNYYDTIMAYNKSLVYAENGTSNVSLAYANRSACFFNMKLYEKCLIDIDLAIAARCSDNLRTKLLSRKSRCLKFIEKNAQFAIIEPKLDFVADERYPCLANILQIEQNDEFGRMITTKEDIPAGKIVMIEKPFMNIPLQCRRVCGTCLDGWTNLVPCPKCTSIMFCKGECEANQLHKIECGMLFSLDAKDHIFSLYIFRSILFALEILPDVRILMDFIANTIDDGNTKVFTEQVNDDLLKYRTFLQMWYANELTERTEFPIQVYGVYKMLLNLPTIKRKFLTLKHQRFLMNLIGHHSCIIRSNTTSPMANLLNHSCAPNVVLIRLGNRNLCVTIRPIEKDGQLFVNYFQQSSMDEYLVNKKRQDHLKQLFEFKCKCERCCLQIPTVKQFQAIKADPLFSYNRQHIKEPSMHGAQEREKILSDFQMFLNKFGRNYWTEEFEIISRKYVEFLQFKYQNMVVFRAQ